METCAAVELPLFRLTARHTPQGNFHLGGLQLCTPSLVVTGFSSHACDPEDLPSSHTGGARVTIWDVGTEKLLVPETASGVSAADLRRGDDAAQEKLSVTTVWGISAGPAADAIASEAPVTPPVMGQDPPILLESVGPSGTVTRCKDGNN